MSYEDILNTYNELKTALENKKDAILKKNVDLLAKLDEETIALCEKIAKFDMKNISLNFTQTQKDTLKALGEEIKNIQENNEILIKHSMDVINSTLSGILNIIQNKNNTYNSKGEKYPEEYLDISSITEEA